MIPLPVNGPTQISRAKSVNSARTINWYPQAERPGATSEIVLYPDPGLVPLQVVGAGPCRVSQGALFLNRLYFVSGNELVSFDAFGNGQSHGTIGTSNGPVELVAGRSLMLILDGSQGYKWDGTTLTSMAATANFPDAASTGVVLNNTFIVNVANSDQFAISDDGATWDSLDVATAEMSPDLIVKITRDKGNLVLCGEDSTELWINTGAADFPFERLPGGSLDWGCQAPRSTVRSSIGVFMLAKNAEGGVMVVLIDGMSVRPISADINDAIGAFDNTADAVGHVYTQQGRWYYQLTFPSADRTFVYNVADQWWHERKSYGIGRHRVQGHGFIGTRHIVGDYQDGQFYELDFRTYTDDGQTIERRRITNAIEQNGQYIAHDSVWLIFDGRGDLSAQGTDPIVRLRYSDDGGNTWGDWLTARIGKMGEYDQIAVFNRLGASRSRIYDILVTEPRPIALVQGFLQAEAFA